MEKSKRTSYSIKEDKEQLGIWDEKEKCIRLQEYWGDYDSMSQDALRENFIHTVSRLIKILPKPVSVLEVGCGTGHNLWAWKDRVKLFGLEYSQEMLQLLREKFKGYEIETLIGDCWHLPYGDNAFDISVQMDVCLHIGGSWESIVEMLRVTKKYVVFTGPSFEDWDDVMSKRIRGKYTWGISVPLLEEVLYKKREMGEIEGFYYLSRPWHGKEKRGRIQHRILVIQIGGGA